jgi:hypothetical protein
MTTETRTCPRCLGNGIMKGFEHVEKGRCFLCSGDGIVSVKVYNAECGVVANRNIAVLRSDDKVVITREGQMTTVASHTGNVVFVYDDGVALAGDGIRGQDAKRKAIAWARAAIAAVA